MAETIEKLDRASEIANERLASMKKDEDVKKAEADQKTKEEADIAFSEKSSAEQQRITEERKQQEAEEDKQIEKKKEELQQETEEE